MSYPIRVRVWDRSYGKKRERKEEGGGSELELELTDLPSFSSVWVEVSDLPSSEIGKDLLEDIIRHPFHVGLVEIWGSRRRRGRGKE